MTGAIQIQAIQKGCHLVIGRTIGADEIRQPGKAGEVGLLDQDADGNSRLDEAGAGIEVHGAGQGLQDCRLAAAVGADQRHALAPADAEADIGEQRPAAERQPRAAQRGNGGR